MEGTTLTTSLQELYDSICSCHVCPEMDPIKALRRTEAVHEGMDVFVISQALAERQLRMSGVNFFDQTGRLGQTGKMLERFLNRFDRTVFPRKSIYLAKGHAVERARRGFTSVYNTEIAQCFPGKGRKGDRPPSPTEVSTCVERGFLIREVHLIRPRLLLLSGDKSRRAFYEHILGVERTDTLTGQLDAIAESGSIPTARIADMTVSVLPIPHPAVRDRTFTDLIENQRLIGIVKEVLA